jgi:thiol-disulfide isomerase/thioredoxin
MAFIVNQYSFVIMALVLALLAGVVLLTHRPRWNHYLAFAALVGGLLLSWAILRPRQTLLSADAPQVQAWIGAGTPALLEFQSPYCLACTAIKPTVDALESQTGDRLRIIRLNVQESAGRQLSQVYGFTYTPTFIFFDGAGQELWRQVGSLDTQRVWDSLP